MNLYAYSYNNSIVYIDPDGKKVYQFTKCVSGTNNHHGWLVAIPDNQKAFKNYFTKENIQSGKVKIMGKIKNKNVYGIIFRAGPQSSNPFNHKKLDNTVRLKDDWDAKRTSSIEIRPPKDNKGKIQTDTKFIRNLIDADKKFTANLNDPKVETPDYPRLGGIGWPEEDERNSNSYVSGLLEAIGAKAQYPSIPHKQTEAGHVKQEAPLYEKPVPQKFYKREK